MKFGYLSILVISFLFSCLNKEEVITSYYKSGEIHEQYFYRGDTLNGHYKIYYPNGILEEEVKFNDGKKNGKETFYYPSGNVRLEGYYVNGIQQGIVVGYFDSPDSNVYTRFYAINDTFQGSYFEFFENGSVKTKAFHIDGFAYYREKFDSLGNVLSDFRDFEVDLKDTLVADKDYDVHFQVFGELYDDLKIYGLLSKMILVELPDSLHPLSVDTKGNGKIKIHTNFDDRNFGYLHLFAVRGDSCINGKMCTIYRREVNWKKR